MSISVEIINPKLQSEANSLLEFFKGDMPPHCRDMGLNDAWRTLVSLPPEATYLTLSFFRPESGLTFLEDLAKGKRVAEVFNLSLLGIDYRAHLNIQGRLAAAEKYLKASPDDLVVTEAAQKIKEFEKKFSQFIEAHREEIKDGLTRRVSEWPQSEQMNPQNVWQSNSTYGVSASLITSARFDHADRDLRNESNEYTSDGFAELKANISLDASNQTDIRPISRLVKAGEWWDEKVANALHMNVEDARRFDEACAYTIGGLSVLAVGINIAGSMIDGHSIKNHLLGNAVASSVLGPVLTRLLFKPSPN